MSTPAPTPEREYIPRYSATPVGLLIHTGTGLTDVDGNLMSVTMTPEAGGPPVFSRNADHTASGTYQTTLQGYDTENIGHFMLTWAFRVDDQPRIEQTFIEVGENDKAYRALDPDLQAVVEQTWIRFADGYDSPVGGPVLQTYFQSHFNRNRLAQLLQLALNRLNSYSQPFQSFNLADPGKFPVARWGSILEQALYIETLKHLIRSYVEIPLTEGAGNFLRMERRDYQIRWSQILEQEEGEFVRRISIYKMSFMGLGRPRVLVSGGVYGNWGPTRLPFAAAQPVFWARFYS
jgi:hypothetical protein